MDDDLKAAIATVLGFLGLSLDVEPTRFWTAVKAVAEDELPKVAGRLAAIEAAAVRKSASQSN